MAFFDGIGKKISQTGQSAVQKTKEMADVVKINTAIAEEEKKLNNYYMQIGRQYAKLHASDQEDAFAELISAVQDSESRIYGFKQQIQDIKGVICCEQCGAEIAMQSAFCSVCGAPVPKREMVVSNENMIQCVGCGQMISREMKFCTSCGKAVSESIQLHMPQQNAEEMDAEKVTENVCQNCGTKLEEGSVFCTECGTKV